MTSKLTQLLEAIEAEDFDFVSSDGHIHAWDEIVPNLQTDRMKSDGAAAHEMAHKAYSGSLDAAKALHDALLPGWEWHLGPSNAKVYPYNGSPLKSWIGMADNAARAWLLAILCALKASREGDQLGKTHS